MDLLGTRKNYSQYLTLLYLLPWQTRSRVLRLGWFLIWPWTYVGLLIGRFIVELPLHLTLPAAAGFSQAARRAPDGEFLESYSGYVQRNRASAVVVMLIVIGSFTSFALLSYSVLLLGRPTRVEAYSTSTTLNPVWDITSQEIADTTTNDLPPPDCFDTAYSYSCHSASAAQLDSRTTTPTCPSLVFSEHIGMKFSVASIPNSATVTKVELMVNVVTATPNTQTVYRLASDSVDTQSCSTGQMHGTLGGSGGTLYGHYTNWNTTGTKTLDLGSSAVTEVQARLTSGDILPLGITSGSTTLGQINSTDNLTGKPTLVVSYTVPPQAPTNTNHSAISLSTITWTWTDNATAETRYDVKNSGGSNVTGCTNLSANTQICTETGLSANTQYIRHPNVTDPDGNTNGPDASAFTAAPSPSVSSVRTTSTWYNTPDFSFTNAAGWGGGGVQYYRYVWDQVSTHIYSGSESTWSNVNANCPGGTCTNAGTTLTKSATTDGNTWYLHVQGFNGDNVASGTADLGPFFFDGSGPAAPGVVNDSTGVDIDSQSSTTELSANWTASADTASGVTAYEYTIGTTPGGTQVVPYTSNGTATAVTRTGLTLSAGTTYYVGVRGLDTAGNTGPATSSDGVAIAQPAIPEVPASPAAPTSPDGRLPTPTPVLPAAGGFVKTSRPLFTGNALSGNTIFLILDGKLENVFKATVDPSGTGSYAYLLRRDLGFGYHTYSVQARDDASGKTSRQSTTRTFITFPDVPATIFDPIADAQVREQQVTVTGVAWSSYDVFVFIDQQLVGVVKASVGHDGVGSFHFTSGTLSPGPHTLHVRMRDPGGNIGLASTLRTFTVSAIGT